jgi:hypothetical protein
MKEGNTTNVWVYTQIILVLKVKKEVTSGSREGNNYQNLK